MDQKHYGVTAKISRWMRISISRNRKYVPNISKSDRIGTLFLIEVIEDQIGFLILLMFSIIVILDKVCFDQYVASILMDSVVILTRE